MVYLKHIINIGISSSPYLPCLLERRLDLNKPTQTAEVTDEVCTCGLPKFVLCTSFMHQHEMHELTNYMIICHLYEHVLYYSMTPMLKLHTDGN